MNIIRYPERSEWAKIIERPHLDTSQLNETVASVLADVKRRGDDAVKGYELKFDHVDLPDLAVSEAEMNEAEKLVSAELKAAIMLAHHNIHAFHEAQKFRGKKVETQPGVTCWQKSVAIEKVGLYIPGGTAPLFSTVLMLATPAKIAGCQEIVLCTPPGRDGKVNPAILVAARIAGVSKIFKAGGVQAIGAMAYGTASIPKVYKIFGPGNQYVMTAKQQVSLCDVAIDMPAGPSEVCVIADEEANTKFIAADLLSQAEHGGDSQVLLITDSKQLVLDVQAELNRQLQKLSRKEIATKALDNSRLVLVKDLQEAIDLSNAYAPEHLIIQTKNYDKLATKVINAGSVFLGEYACESAGDYASGTNHTLPTSGLANAWSGLGVESFMHAVTWQQLSREALEGLAPTIIEMAEAEGLAAHAEAVRKRIYGKD